MPDLLFVYKNVYKQQYKNLLFAFISFCMLFPLPAPFQTLSSSIPLTPHLLAAISPSFPRFLVLLGAPPHYCQTPYLPNLPCATDFHCCGTSRGEPHLIEWQPHNGPLGGVRDESQPTCSPPPPWEGQRWSHRGKPGAPTPPRFLSLLQVSLCGSQHQPFPTAPHSTVKNNSKILSSFSTVYLLYFTLNPPISHLSPFVNACFLVFINLNSKVSRGWSGWIATLSSAFPSLFDSADVQVFGSDLGCSGCYCRG